MKIPGYQIEHEIGHGGMATVYLATQQSLGRKVALKVMSPALAADRTFGQRFQREAHTVARLSHPNIITVHDIGSVEHYHYIALEYIEGGDLKARLAQGALAPEEALGIIGKIAAALAYAHDQRVIHRDVKPENILFRADGSPVLTDFGIARAAGAGTRMTATGSSIGTPHYMSPEQARGKEVDPRADLYSLGVMLYEMLTGKVPFDAADTYAIGLMHITEAPPALPDSLLRYQPLLDRLLAKDPDARYQSGKALEEDIRRLLAGGPLTPASRSSGRPKSQRAAQLQGNSRFAGSLPWIVSGAGLAIIVVVLLIAFGDRTLSEPASFAAGAADGGSDAAGTSSGGLLSLGRTRQPGPGDGAAILQVASEPTGMEVWLGEHKLGETPYLGEDLPAGQHMIELRGRYHAPTQIRVSLEDNVVAQYSATLERGAGRVTIVTEPPDARVRLDDGRVHTSPVTVRDVPAGEYTVFAAKDRYREISEAVEVLPGETARVNLQLPGGDLVEYNGEWLEPEEAAERRRVDEVAAAETNIERMISQSLAQGLSTYGEINNRITNWVEQGGDASRAAAMVTDLLAAMQRRFEDRLQRKQYGQLAGIVTELRAIADARDVEVNSQRFSNLLEEHYRGLRNAGRLSDMIGLSGHYRSGIQQAGISWGTPARDLQRCYQGIQVPLADFNGVAGQLEQAFSSGPSSCRQRLSDYKTYHGKVMSGVQSLQSALKANNAIQAIQAANQLADMATDQFDLRPYSQVADAIRAKVRRNATLSESDGGQRGGVSW